ncbi:hypothetical protein [Pelagerythrobacter marinus]|jgi:hypothetical protein|uniref:Lipoprotein n=1 Tax=Pelagerythrobacter marinus TaxID=538382 RepID=A0ABW9USD1_9SPHN|nr:hypothetical protein [Pelagerythrobacter marinus]MXO67308.1 hypothetical protein [Pelagerythrobacter marinus]USA38646.1 hypothetical protein NCF86_09975 [Pelagerythrobacter marinus]WPZ07327.1 hypothetical protein T8T98_02070 [Pelagerythrobacter marinus]
MSGPSSARGDAVTFRPALGAALVLLAGCKPPATDDYVERVALDETRARASDPLPSPDVEGALWAETGQAGRLVYGKPGEAPLLALACEQGAGAARIRVTRFVSADPKAKAVLALVGNGHAARIPVDATWNGRAWLWEGHIAADDPAIGVLTGPRRIEATVPAGGTVEINPSPRPRHLVEVCAGQRAPGDPVPPEPG